MARGPGIELADVLREWGECESLPWVQRKAVKAVLKCRTAAAGGHARVCRDCGYEEIAYNSCGNRHCPKCGGRRQKEWLAKQLKTILPVPYHHAVFTVPDGLNAVFLSSPAVSYGLLFEAVSETLKEVAANPRHLGAAIGFTAVLHTWTQTMQYHPHIHCLVPGGGLSPTGSWVKGRDNFFLPVRILSKVFRGKLLSKFEQAMDAGRLPGGPPGDKGALRAAARKSWMVFSKTPAVGADQVLRYLSTYVHRVAISNNRLVSFEDGHVTFLYKDRPNGGVQREMTLSVDSFARLFLLHVLPPGFVKVRHYGFLAGPCRSEGLALCRAGLDCVGPGPVAVQTNADASPPDETAPEAPGPEDAGSLPSCPACQGRMVVTAWFSPAQLVQWLLRGSATAS